MTRKELLEAIKKNSIALINGGMENNDKQMALLGHVSLTAIEAIEKGHDAELALIMLSFSEFLGSNEEEEKVEEELSNILANAGICMN